MNDLFTPAGWPKWMGGVRTQQQSHVFLSNRETKRPGKEQHKLQNPQVFFIILKRLYSVNRENNISMSGCLIQHILDD